MGFVLIPLIPFILAGVMEGANVGAPELDDKPLTEATLAAANKALESIKNAGDPADVYNPPYTTFLTDCCMPHFTSLFGNIQSGGVTRNELRAQLHSFAMQGDDFIKKNGIEIPKDQIPTDESQLPAANNSVDRALIDIGKFNLSAAA